MSLLLSNYPPVKTSHEPFNEVFLDLIKRADTLDIAVGYISEKALEYLGEQIYKRGKPLCNLIIGMHYFEKFTRPQYTAAKEIESFFLENKLGAVHLVTSFPYHGKVYSFKLGDGKNVSIVGSSNLTNIVAYKPIRKYELDVLIKDEQINLDISSFIENLRQASPKLFSTDVKIKGFKNIENLLEGLSDVETVEPSELDLFKSKLILEKSIEIPISTAEKSNLNVYFGKGRINPKRSAIRQRPWYEVELIVPKKITELEHYPKPKKSQAHKSIEVMTDDGCVFSCSIGGDYNKNFRSENDLKILGRWLKGKLEKSQLLSIGELVTKEVLRKYGRDTITLIPSTIKDKWFIDFSRKTDDIIKREGNG